MSTRCQIGFYEQDNPKSPHDFEALIYRHSDGYPNGEHGVLADLLTAVKRYGRVAENCSSFLLYEMMDKSVKDYKKYYARNIKKYVESSIPKDGKTGLSFGICKVFHGNIAYFYAVMPSSVRVYKTDLWDNSSKTWKHFELVLEIPVGKELEEAAKAKEM